MKAALRKFAIAIAWRVALPIAWLWVSRHQQRILANGRKLSEAEQQIAEDLGIEHADRVRVWSVDRVPTPGGLILRAIGRIAGLSTHGAKGMALEHGVYLESAQANRRSLIAHELAHVAQYQRLGGRWDFLRDYLRQCLSEGYWNAPLEIEAREKAEELGGGHEL